MLCVSLIKSLPVYWTTEHHMLLHVHLLIFHGSKSMVSSGSTSNALEILMACTRVDLI